MSMNFMESNRNYISRVIIRVREQKREYQSDGKQQSLL